MISSVPKKSVIAGLAAAGVVGALFTLMHQPASKAADYPARNSTSAEITPSLSSQGVVENSSLDVRVNGREVPVREGTTTVPIPGGSASVTVQGNSSSVTATSNGGSSSSSNVNISVQSHSQTVGTSSTVQQSHTSTTSGGNHTSSDVHITGDGAQVKVHTK